MKRRFDEKALHQSYLFSTIIVLVISSTQTYWIVIFHISCYSLKLIYYTITHTNLIWSVPMSNPYWPYQRKHSTVHDTFAGRRRPKVCRRDVFRQNVVVLLFYIFTTYLKRPKMKTKTLQFAAFFLVKKV
jgi:hypothetical protein